MFDGTLVLAMADGPMWARLHALLAERCGTVELVDPKEPPAGLAGASAVVHLPAVDPFDCGDGLPGELARLCALAGDANARMIFCSSCLLYKDLGEEENAANDPELDPPEELMPFARAELELFGSSAEVMMLRLGILLEARTAAADELKTGLRDGLLCVPDDGPRYVPLLDLETLADAISRVAASKLHGAWDLVSDVAPLDGLLGKACEIVGGKEPQRVAPAVAFERAGQQAGARWLRSRRVTGAALVQAGAAEPGDWTAIVRAAL